MKNTDFTDVLKIQGVNAQGFGTIPKLVMVDKRLTIESKAIYAYFCSYAGSGSTAFPSRDKICSDLDVSVNRYYKHLKLLKEYGYLKIEQVKKYNKKFSHNVYTLVMNPEVEEPCIQNKDTVPCIRFRCTENEYTNINSSFININSINNQSVSQGIEEDKSDGQIDEIFEILNMRMAVKDLKIAYPDDNHLIDEVVMNVFDMYLSKYTIINGQKKPQDLVRSAVMKITYFHVEALIEKFKNVKTKIKNHKAYMQTMIYNIAFESDLAVTNQVNYDLYNTQSVDEPDDEEHRAKASCSFFDEYYKLG